MFFLLSIFSCNKQKKANELVQKAYSLEQKGDFESSLKLLSEALKLDSLHPYANYNRGNIYLKLKNYSSAFDDFTKVIRLNSKDHDAYFNRSICDKEMKEYDQAINDLNRAIEINPIHDYYKARAGVFWLSKKFRLAIADYDSAISLSPNNAEYYSLRAYSYEELGEFDKAIKDYTKSIQLDESDYRTYFDRGNAFLIIGDKDKACKDWDNAIKLGDPRKDEIIIMKNKNCC